ncbi:MAG: hypothetical protein AB9869_19510 [Verrucomicrobiia bacterium]
MKTSLQFAMVLGGTVVLTHQLSLAQPAFVLDPTFRPTITAPGGEIRSTVVQPDGRLIVFGRFDIINGVPRIDGARLNRDGSVDEGYAPTGLIYSPEKTVVQSDGKLLIVGAYRTSGSIEIEGGLFRLHSDGRLDSAFFVSPHYGTDQSGAIQRLVVQPDGKILLGGWFNRINGQPRRGLARLNHDGSLDTAFDAGRGLEGPTGRGEADHFSAPRSIAVQPDGKILLGGGFTRAGGLPRNAIARLNADGTVDPAFAPEIAGDLFAIIVQSTGKIVIVGRFSRVNGEPRQSVARLNPDGTLDSGFRTGPGFRPPEGAVTALPIPGRGDILLWSPFDAGPIFRLDAEGERDLSWIPVSGYPVGTVDGRLVSENPGRERWVFHDDSGRAERVVRVQTETASTAPVTLQPDGRMLMLLGEGGTRVNGIAPAGRLVRLYSDGSLDSSLHLDLVSTRQSNQVGQVWCFALMPDGKIAIGGDFTSVNGTPRDWMARLNADGSVDQAFDPGGVGPNPFLMVAQRNGSLVVSGGNGLFRLTPAGGVDPSFMAKPDFSLEYSGNFRPNTSLGPNDTLLTRQPDGSVVRLKANGAVDESFVAVAPIWNPMVPLVLLEGGKYLAATALADAPLLPARFNPDGTLDTGFVFDAGSRLVNPFLLSLTPQQEGKILVGLGSNSSGSDLYDGTILRLRSDGSEDPTFTPIVFTFRAPPPTAWGLFIEMTILSQPDGGLLMTGLFSEVNGYRHLGIARFEPVPVLQVRQTQLDGPFRVVIAGKSGWTYRLETSSDLQSWRFGGELPSTGELTEFSEPPVAKDGTQFYRVSVAQ